MVLETRYEPQTATTSAVDKPNMLVSANMTGAVQVWESGYTGAGTRVAIIDTGLDTDHQSFDPGALVATLWPEDAQLAECELTRTIWLMWMCWTKMSLRKSCPS